MRLFTSPYIKVKCADGNPRYILRNPKKAFSPILSYWDARIKALTRFFDKAQVGLNIGLQRKASSIVQNLNQNYAILQANYQAAYIAYAAHPCGEKSQEILEKANEDIQNKDFILRKLFAETRILSKLAKQLNAKKPKKAKEVEELVDDQIAEIASLASKIKPKKRTIDIR